MSNEKTIANLVKLMTSFHLEIRALPDDLKCAKCKSVLKNACQMPCGCRFCRTCIDDVISRGDQFCPGGSQECGATPLSTAVPDYSANKSVLRLTAKCPHAGCQHEFPLADVQGHMRACSSKNIDCPFRELGCTQGALPGDEMSGHLLQERCSHSEILIGTVANISRDMEMLKRELLMKDEHMENEMKLIKDEMKSIKIENESIKDENKSIKFENESIKREKELLCDRVRQLSEKLERDSVMKCQMESILVAVGLQQLDDWLIEWDVAWTAWGLSDWNSAKTSGIFGGGERPFIFELASLNSVSKGGELWISLLIWAGPNDSLLQWPFRGAVTVSVADRDRVKACSRQTRQCQIKRPADNQYSRSDWTFVFSHAALRGAGLNLGRGARISCWIVPGVAGDTVSRHVSVAGLAFFDWSSWKILLIIISMVISIVLWIK